MGKVIKLESYSKEYQKAVEEVIAELEKMEQNMFDRAIGLLMVGKWIMSIPHFTDFCAIGRSPNADPFFLSFDNPTKR